MEKLVELREHHKATTNIETAQERQKYYDAKHDSNHESNFATE